MKIEFEGTDADVIAIMELLLSRYPDADLNISETPSTQQKD